ncbi:OprO/OprP family phosphate-selective porin [Myxococcota bacterium]|nr:OprO/OprP family phosphate-selective porin [Myxococcota bacterium]
MRTLRSSLLPSILLVFAGAAASDARAQTSTSTTAQPAAPEAAKADTGKAEAATQADAKAGAAQAEAGAQAQGETAASAKAQAGADAKGGEKAGKPKKLFERGFTLTADDDRFALRFRALLQADGRIFVGDDLQKAADTLLLRAVRPSIEGKAFGFVTFQLVPEFGNARAEVLDAWVDLEAHPALRLRIGKQKVNFGLERLKSSADITFAELSEVSTLTPNRDVGVQLHGQVLDGALAYSAGVWNGAPDGASVDVDVDDQKDLVGRVYLKPFRLAGVGLLREVGLGVAASYGTRTGAPKSPQLPAYRSPAQQTILSFDTDADLTAAGTSVADGTLARISPQAAIYVGPVGLMAEYVRVSQEVKKGDDRATLVHDGWELTASVLVTGEKATYGALEVARPAALDPFAPGAIELVFRYDVANYSREGFGRFITRSKSYESAQGLWAGANWYLNAVAKVTAYYVHTSLTGGPANLPDSEDALIIRTQLAF